MSEITSAGLLRLRPTLQCFVACTFTDVALPREFFIHPGLIAAAMVDAGKQTTKASGLAVGYSMAAGICQVDKLPWRH